MEYKFIALDPSMTNTGIVVGVIKNDKIEEITHILLSETKKSSDKKVPSGIDTINRCRTAFDVIREAIQVHKPRVIFAEMPSGSQSAAAMKSYGVTCMMLGALRPVPIPVTPTHVKKASVGRKNASKADMIRWAFELYPDLSWLKGSKNKMEIIAPDGKYLGNKNEHIADAIAAAHAGVETDDFKRIKEFIKNESQF